MKELLTLVSLLLSAVLSEAQYAPSGWRPDGPAFVIPERTQFLAPQQQEYLPPVDPRRPLTPNFDDADVSVQGLPSIEPQPIFEVSPINGQQYTGPSINADIGRLNPSFQQAQYQQQLEKARQFARQREFENTRARVPNNGLPNQQSPRQFASPSSTTTQKPEPKTTQAETTTEALTLNEGETLDGVNTKDQKDKVSVEVTKQNLQEYPPEIFLNPLAQLKLQPQFVPLQQFGQLRAPLIYPAQLQDGRTPGLDGLAHLSALPSVLAQQAQGQGFAQTPIIVQQEPFQPGQRVQPIQPVQPVDPVQNEEPDQKDDDDDDDGDVEPIQRQLTQKQGPAFPQTQTPQIIVQSQPINQIQPDQFQQPQLQFQPQLQLQPQVQYQPQSQFQIQPQLAQPNQFAPQPQFIQPQSAQSNQFPQTQLQFQPQPVQPNQFPQTQLQFQPQPVQPNQFPQTQLQFQPQPIQPNQYPQPQLQFQPQPQPNQFLQPERPKDVEEIEPTDQQVVYQNYQPQFYPQQFQNQYQNPDQPLFLAQQQLGYQNQEQFNQDQSPQQYNPQQYNPKQDNPQQYNPQQYNPQQYNPQQDNPQQYNPQQDNPQQYNPQQYNPQQYNPQQDNSQQYNPQQAQPQDGQPLQSGFDVNMQGNDIEQTEDQESEQEEEGPRVTAVAAAFGTRTQPRVFPKYGAPIPKVQQDPGYPRQTTTESTAREEAQDEDGPAVAQATAVATGRRNAKLRSRRVRPIFTLDRSGHLVLAQQQN